MRRVPWSTIVVGLLWFLSTSLGGQTAQSPQTQSLPPPGASDERGRVIGIGGIFFRSANRDQAREWYAKHLGIVDKGQGALLPWREHDDPSKEHLTIWTVFNTTSTYFEPGQPLMINYIVDDMDALLDRLGKEGVRIDPKRADQSNARFAWIYDADGNKVELWQPVTKTK
jgi:catechol 2,3-dioxygenase-like lactoylglutathione lyase family enzyme